MSDQVSGDTGRMPLADVLGAAIQLAESRWERGEPDGVVLSLFVARELARALAPEPSGVPPEEYTALSQELAEVRASNRAFKEAILRALGHTGPWDITTFNQRMIEDEIARLCRATTEVERVAPEWWKPQRAPRGWTLDAPCDCQITVDYGAPDLPLGAPCGKHSFTDLESGWKLIQAARLSGATPKEEAR